MKRRFSEQDVRDFRRVVKEDGVSIYKLAKIHGVTYPTMFHLVHGSTYRDVPSDEEAEKIEEEKAQTVSSFLNGVLGEK